MLVHIKQKYSLFFSPLDNPSQTSNIIEEENNLTEKKELVFKGTEEVANVEQDKQKEDTETSVLKENETICSSENIERKDEVEEEEEIITWCPVYLRYTVWR